MAQKKKTDDDQGLAERAQVAADVALPVLAVSAGNVVGDTIGTAAADRFAADKSAGMKLAISAGTPAALGTAIAGVSKEPSIQMFGAGLIVSGGVQLVKAALDKMRKKDGDASVAGIGRAQRRAQRAAQVAAQQNRQLMQPRAAVPMTNESGTRLEQLRQMQRG